MFAGSRALLPSPALILALVAVLIPCLTAIDANAATLAQSSSELPTLVTALQVHSLSSKEAARAYPVHLKAVVTYFDPALANGGFVPLFVHDASGCIFVRVAQGSISSLPAGSLIDLRGVSHPGEFAPTIALPQINVIGYAGLPSTSDRPSLVRLLSGAEDGQWVEVEGVIHSIQETDHHVNLQLTMADGTISILMSEGMRAAYSRLVDAKVRIRGNAGPLMDRNRRQMIGVNIHCPDLSAVEIVEPAPADPFQLQTIPIDRLLQWDLAPLLAHRVHLRGKVTLQWPGSSICIRDTTQGICAQTDQDTSLRIGELVDLAGFATAEGSSPALTDAVFRGSGPALAAPVAAVPVTGEQALLGNYESQLVQIEGRLISHDLASADTTLLISSGKYIFKAILPQRLASPVTEAWKDGSTLRVTGICSVQLDARKSALGLGTAVPTTFQVLMRSTEDVSVIQNPSWWTPLHAALLLTLALAATMVVLVWVAALRKRVELQADLLRESERRFRHLAQHDSLTGLATRAVLHDRLNAAFASCARNQTGLGVLMIDVDKFKNINDTFGHHAGDEVLRVTSNRLVETVRSSDTIIRLGGDEFLVLLTDLPSPQVAETIAAGTVAALSLPILFEGIQVPFSVSVGVCTSSKEEQLDSQALLRRADAALYRAKARGRHCFHVFGLDMDRASVVRQDSERSNPASPSAKCA